MLFDPAHFARYIPVHSDEYKYARNLNALKGRLKKNFAEAFGKEALENYYTGKTRVQKYNAEDKAQEKMGKPWLLSKPFNPHFPHEEFAELLGVKFVNLHGTLQSYFMAVAMHEHTGNTLYSDLAEDLFTDFEVAAHQNRLPGVKRISQRKFKEVRTEIARSVDVMIEHTLPPRYRLPETPEKLMP